MGEISSRQKRYKEVKEWNYIYLSPMMLKSEMELFSIQKKLKQALSRVQKESLDKKVTIDFGLYHNLGIDDYKIHAQQMFNILFCDLYIMYKGDFLNKTIKIIGLNPVGQDLLKEVIDNNKKKKLPRFHPDIKGSCHE